MHEQDLYWMQQALLLAEKANQINEVPVGALIVKNNEVIGEGYNRPITDHDPTAHAEICALRAAAQTVQNYRMPGTTMYITIEPCSMCLGAIIHARIDRLVFGALEPKAGVLQSNPELISSGIFNHSLEWTGGVLAEECTAIIQQFFQRRRREKKENR
ncbi:tRNA adenosine(34) deaminase TadA [Teredinibacter sp. KSP-S5-2]|uniref:tRNA adenosine(34) deaminase TadA n=1 Tax=Teredinibacter sp. KSP-S5-2 TaxID=3034506 RepID=UPI002934F118|nr:tRNA adenosine(34) deaminase TadA [Teredinibacter sp. KSP-S5-2]WNO11583.1 tRNA adenosine(34) deaminase TadA [Teredinibacter sp. KSP-S5-2]